MKTIQRLAISLLCACAWLACAPNRRAEPAAAAPAASAEPVLDPPRDPVDPPPPSDTADPGTPSSSSGAPRSAPTLEQLAAAKADSCAALLTRAQEAGLVSIWARMRVEERYRNDKLRMHDKAYLSYEENLLASFSSKLASEVPADAVVSKRLLYRGTATWGMEVKSPALKWLCASDAIESLGEDSPQQLY